MSSSLVLLSGGLDSAANLALACESQNTRPVLALTVDYGQRAAAREKQSARLLCEYYDVPHRVMELPWLGQLGASALTDSRRSVPVLQAEDLDLSHVTRQSAQAVWVPNRNGLLINLAAALADAEGIDQILVGFNREEASTFPDNSPEYLRAASQALAFSTARRVSVQCFSSDWDKTEIMLQLKKLKRPFPFKLLWSCYHEGPNACGRCESCQRYLRALDQAEVQP